MFLHLSVILFTGGVCLSACWDTTPPQHQSPPRSRHPPGPGTPPGAGTPPRTRHPPPADGYCCGWYASYWNAFFLLVMSTSNTGCDVNQMDRFQESALVIPICHGDTEIVTTLLHAGCRLTGRSWGNTRYSIWSYGR